MDVGSIATLPERELDEPKLSEHILECQEKMELCAREVVSDIARNLSVKRKQSGVQDDRGEEELKKEDWLKAEQIFCDLMSRELNQ